MFRKGFSLGGISILQFKLEDWSIFKDIFTSINEIIDEIVIECTPEGLDFTALDRSHICFFECNIPKKSFDEYSIDRLMSLYIDVKDVVDVLKRGKKKDKLIFKADKSTFDIIFKNKNTRTFSITQIDMDYVSRDMPKLEYDVSFEFDYDFIKDCIEDAKLYSHVLSFQFIDDILILYCEGSFGKYKNEFQLDEYIGNCNASYGVDWLLKIFKNKLSSDKLKINMGDEYPMLVEIKENDIRVKYLLAPRIDNGED